MTLAVAVIVSGLAPAATVASAQPITLAQTAQHDPCSGRPLSQVCDAVNAIGNVWAELEKDTQPKTAAQQYFLSFAYVKDCAPSFITGELGWAITLSQWQQILGGILNLLPSSQIKTFWDNYQEIRNFPLTPYGGCLPPAWVIKANHPILWKALSSVWLVPVFGGGTILPIFHLPSGSSKSPPAILPAAPTGLTVRANPSNGTVLRLTWHDNATNETSFQVSNGTANHNMPAHPGKGTVNYTWTGLKPGTEACFKVRATNHLGDSAWDPNAAPWHVCARTSSPSPAPAPSPSPPPGPCTPKINAVGPLNASADATLEIVGSCFGTGNTASAADTAYFRISDLTAGWNACWTGDPGTDAVTCNIPDWTDTTIIFDGFTGAYGSGSWVISNGDHIEVQVWNPQSGKGPATCQLIAGSSNATNC